MKKTLYEKYFKRVLDFIFSLIALIFLSPIMLVISIMIKIFLGSPVIFSQQRPGKNEKIFRMYKFRTMNNKRDENGLLLPDDKRLTKLGKILRSSSLDELPGLINILKGDMSIVGPRPLLIEYLNLYNEEQRLRHKVLPGLTGLAQVNGRNAITWEQKFSYDIEYVNSISFGKDLLIILKTIKKVLIREGISSTNSVTMEKFQGEKDNE